MKYRKTLYFSLGQRPMLPSGLQSWDILRGSFPSMEGREGLHMQFEGLENKYWSEPLPHPMSAQLRQNKKHRTNKQGCSLPSTLQGRDPLCPPIQDSCSSGGL